MRLIVNIWDSLGWLKSCISWWIYYSIIIGLYLNLLALSLTLPADSTAGEILKRAGLVKKRRKRNYYAADEQAFESCKENNQVWGVDYKTPYEVFEELTGVDMKKIEAVTKSV